MEEVCNKTNISLQTFFRWRKEYGRRIPSETKRLKQLDQDNKRLKKLVADPFIESFNG